jgi:uncharacterized protein (DUF58 family)
VLAREILQRVREIQVRTGRQVADVLAGEYVSVFKGRGLEFDEVRPYVPGDDVRTLDWKVTARMGEPYVKRYVEERQLTLMLMADVSASQDFGSGRRSKREAAAELCALLAFSAIRNSDKVGLTLFHGGIEQYIPPRKGQKHALRVVREVLAHGLEGTQDAPAQRRGAHRSRAALAATAGRADGSRLAAQTTPQAGAASAAAHSPPTGARRAAQGLRGLGRRALAVLRRGRARSAAGAAQRSPREATAIGGAMEFLLSVTPRKTICFVVSDFLDDDFERALRTANRKHDVIAVLITDAAELALPDIGLVALRDAESGRTRLYDTSSEAYRAAFERNARARVEALQRRMRASGIDFIHVDATESVVEPLVRFFRMRERRSRR